MNIEHIRDRKRFMKAVKSIQNSSLLSSSQIIYFPVVLGKEEMDAIGKLQQQKNNVVKLRRTITNLTNGDLFHICQKYHFQCYNIWLFINEFFEYSKYSNRFWWVI